MPTWEEFCNGLKKITNKVIVKTEELADTASLHLKLAQKEANLSELYEEFGKLTYDQIKQENSNEEKAEDLIKKLDTLTAEISVIKTEIQSKKSENKEETEKND